MSDDLSSAELLDALSRHRESYRQRFADIHCLGFADVIARSKIGRPRLLKDLESKEREQRSASAGSGDPRDPEQRQKPVEPTRDEQLLADLITRKKTRLFITGEGGIGKTEFTRHLAYHLADKLDPIASQALIPIRIELKAIEPTGPTFLCRLVGLSSPIAPALLERMARAGRIAFILDGLDELNPAYTRPVFDPHFQDFIEKYKTCTFILAGRPGILNTLGTCFPASAQFEIEPLKNDEIQRYITDYFAAVDAPARGAELAKAVKRSGAVMRPVLTQPFLLALTCVLYHDNPGIVTLPNDPATLLEEGLKRLFERRKSQAGLDNAIPLKLPSTTCLDALGVLFAHSIEKRYAPSSGEATAALVRHMKISEDEADSWLAQLAPACGVLIKTVSGYRHTNRVIAEYLAARWIAMHGWSGPGRGPSAVTTADRSPATIPKFYSHYVWSNQHRNLLHWLGFVVSQTREGEEQLMRIARWLVGHLKSHKSQNGGSPRHDDQCSTLLLRLLDLLSALPMSAIAADDPRLTRMKADLHEIVPLENTQGDEYRALMRSRLAPGLVIDYVQHLVNRLSQSSYPSDKIRLAVLIVQWGDYDWTRSALEAALENSTNEGDICALVHALGLRWSGDESVGAALCKKLASQEQPGTISVIAEELASNWNMDRQTGVALLAKLTAERDNETIACLVKSIGASWPELTPELGPLLEAKLQTATESSHIAILATAIASRCAGDPQMATALQAKLERESAQCVGSLTKALALGWAKNPTVRDALLAKFATKREYWFDTAEFAQALALGWAGDPWVGDALRQALILEEDERVFTQIAHALAAGWAQDKPIGAALINKLVACQNSYPIKWLAEVMLKGWAGNDEVGNALSRKLAEVDAQEAFIAIAKSLASGWPRTEGAGKIIRDELEKSIDCEYVVSLAGILASGWERDEASCRVIRAKLSRARDHDTIAGLAYALASGWAGHELSGKVLRDKCDEATNDKTIECLANALASGWGGDRLAGEGLWSKLNVISESFILVNVAQSLMLHWPEYIAQVESLLLEQFDAQSSAEGRVHIARCVCGNWPKHTSKVLARLRPCFVSAVLNSGIYLSEDWVQGWARDDALFEAVRECLEQSKNQTTVDRLCEILAAARPDDVRSVGLVWMKAPNRLRALFPNWVILGSTSLKNADRCELQGWVDRCGWRNAPDKRKNVLPDCVIFFGLLDGPAGGLGLRRWAERCGWIPPLKSNPPDGSIGSSVIESFHLGPLDKPDPLANFQNPDNPKKNAATPGQNEREFGFILAPREKLRPGLDPLLDPDQPTGDATAKPASKGGIPIVWETLVPIIEKHIKEHSEPVLTPLALAKHLHDEGKTETTHHYMTVERALIAVLEKFSKTEDFKHLVDLWMPSTRPQKHFSHDENNPKNVKPEDNAAQKGAPGWVMSMVEELTNSELFKENHAPEDAAFVKQLLEQRDKDTLKSLIKAFKRALRSRKRN